MTCSNGKFVNNRRIFYIYIYIFFIIVIFLQISGITYHCLIFPVLISVINYMKITLYNNSKEGDILVLRRRELRGKTKTTCDLEKL